MKKAKEATLTKIKYYIGVGKIRAVHRPHGEFDVVGMGAVKVDGKNFGEIAEHWWSAGEGAVVSWAFVSSDGEVKAVGVKRPESARKLEDKSDKVAAFMAALYKRVRRIDHGMSKVFLGTRRVWPFEYDFFYFPNGLQPGT